MRRYLFLALVLALLLLPLTVNAASPWDEARFLHVLVGALIDGDLTVGDDATVGGDAAITGNTAIGGTLAVTGATALTGATTLTGNATFAGTLDVTGDATVGADMTLGAQTALTVTNGAAFTVTGTYQPIQAAENVTPTITKGAAGDVLVVVNVSDTTITIADTGAAMLSADAALGQYDTLTLISDGTNWIELARANN